MEPFQHLTRLLHGPPPARDKPPPEAAVDPTGAAARGQSAELLGQPSPPPSSPGDAQATELSSATPSDAEPPDPVAACVAERGGDPAYRDGGLPDPAEVAALTAACETEQQGHAERPEAPEPIPTRQVLDALATGRWDTDTLAARLTDQQLATLPGDERAALIDHIAHGTWVGGDDEATLVRLIATAPDPAALLDMLSADRAALLRQLDAVIDGDGYTAYRRALRRAYFAAQDPADVAAAMDDPVTLPWADPGLIGALLGERRVAYDTVEYTDEGKIDVAGYVTVGPMGVPFELRGLDPLELIAVRYFADEAAFEAGEGETQYMPAAEFVGLYHKQQGQVRDELTDLALVGLGGMGVAGAASRLGKVGAAIEAAIGAADLVIRSQRDAIAESEDGRTFLSVWDKIVTLTAIYGAAQVALSVPHFVAAAQKSWGRVASRVDPAARRAVDEQLATLDDAADEARRAQTPPAERMPEAGEIDEAAKLDDAAAPRVEDDAGRVDDVEAPPERAGGEGEIEPPTRAPEDPEAAFHAEVRQKLATMVDGQVKKALKAYEFPSGSPAPAKVRKHYEDTYAAEYATRLRAGEPKKQASRAAQSAALRSAKALATQEARAAARARALDDVKSGAAFGPTPSASVRGAKAAYESGEVGQSARGLSPRLTGKSMDEVQDVLDADVAAGRSAVADDPLVTDGVILPQKVYTYPDGTVVRVKPGGDGYRSKLVPGPPDYRPKYSVEVRNLEATQVRGQGDIAFKVGSDGAPVPKGPGSIHNPYNSGTNGDQFESYQEAVMEAAHHLTREAE